MYTAIKICILSFTCIDYARANDKLLAIKFIQTTESLTKRRSTEEGVILRSKASKRKMIESPPVSKFRSASSQLSAAFPYFCLNMSAGTAVGFQTILIAELYKDNSEIATSVDQLSWFASLDILNIMGLIIGGILMQRFGTHKTAFFTSLIYISSWLLYYYSNSISSVIVARVVSSVTATASLTNPYVSEISEPYLRGTFLIIAQMAIIIGSFITLLLGTFMYWRTIALVNLSMPIMTALTVLLVPNSPIWLANTGRLDEARKALCSLRGWVQPNQVEIEFQTLVESMQKSISSVDAEKIGWRERWIRTFKLFHRRSFYAPLSTMCLIFLVYILGGAPMIDSYATVIFRELNSPIDESVATAILGAMSIIGKLIVLSFVRRLGRRKLVLFFSGVVFFCQTLTATIALLKFTHSYYSWIPSIALIVTNLSWKSGIAAISYVIVSEIFPSDVRYTGTAVCYAFYAIVVSIMKKWFLYVVEALTLPVVFGIFAMLNALEFVTYYLLMPETEGKSLQEIENHFNRDQINDERFDKSKNLDNK